MQSRVEKYSNLDTGSKLRSHKNQDLYDELKNSTINDYEVTPNESVINDNNNNIDVDKIKQILEKKYSEKDNFKLNLDIPEYPENTEEQLNNTKEYDINAVLEKAKQGKNVNYNEQRLRKVREAQLEILTNLDLELKKVEEGKKSVVINENDKEELNNLMNTLTALEIENRKTVAKGSTDDLFDDLIDKTETSIEEIAEDIANIDEEQDRNAASIVPEIDLSKIENSSNEEETKSDSEEKYCEDEENEEIKEKTVQEKEDKEDKEESNYEETLTKLEVNNHQYDDFKDISKNDAGSIILKIIAFFVVIAILMGAVYIINNVLELGLF